MTNFGWYAPAGGRWLPDDDREAREEARERAGDDECHRLLENDDWRVNW